MFISSSTLLDSINCLHKDFSTRALYDKKKGIQRESSAVGAGSGRRSNQKAQIRNASNAVGNSWLAPRKEGELAAALTNRNYKKRDNNARDEIFFLKYPTSSWAASETSSALKQSRQSFGFSKKTTTAGRLENAASRWPPLSVQREYEKPSESYLFSSTWSTSTLGRATRSGPRRCPPLSAVYENTRASEKVVSSPRNRLWLSLL